MEFLKYIALKTFEYYGFIKIAERLFKYSDSM